MDRKFLPYFAELIDRLSIHQLKEIFISEKKDKYSSEMDDIVYDLNRIIEEKNIKLSGELIRAIVVLAQMNLHIWQNESKTRSTGDGDLKSLKLTHGLNGVRSTVQNIISTLIDQTERLDWKTDCLAAEFKEWEISLLKKKIEKPTVKDK